MQRITFLVGLPRIGSLALSKIMNTSECGTMHEGGDYDLAFTNKPFKHTVCYDKMMECRAKGRHFLSCDTSVCLPLIEEALQYGDPDCEIRIMYVSMCLRKCVDSLTNLMGDTPRIAHYGEMAMIESNMLRALINYRVVDKIKVKIIEKVGRKFTVDQLTEMSHYCGAWGVDFLNNMDALRDKDISLTREELRSAVDRINTIHEKYRPGASARHEVISSS